MKERFLEVIQFCIVLIVMIIGILFMIILTPFYPFIYVITGKNLYHEIQNLCDKTLDKIGNLLGFE
jgi:hypothetical protein